MPLRFSGTIATTEAVAAVDLPPRAQALLATGELEGYRELFRQSGLVEDPHRRYWAAVGLIEQGLAAAASTSAKRLASLFATIADGALEVLEAQPAEPKLLNYAGVAFYELWSLEAAQKLFKAAIRLDPTLAQGARNLREVAKRKRQAASARQRRPMHPALTELARRASSLAESAQPAEGLTLSLCMIVRDEEEMLPRCLAAAAPAVDEIVIVDTGSSDRTVEIARSFGAHVIEREWTGSFAEARNVSFDAAKGDWLMYLDADEVLVQDDAPMLRALTGRTWREAFYLSETNYTGELGDGTAVTHNALRIFRNRPEYRFEGRLHEQIANRLPGYLPERLEATGVRVEHYGYLGVVRDSREKSRRNIELLRLQLSEGGSSPFLHYNLGSEYAAAGDNTAALQEFERSWSMMNDHAERDSYEFAPALMSRLVKALRTCGHPQRALSQAQEGLEIFPGFTDLVLEQANAALAQGDAERAIELLERCIEMGDAPRRYTATVGAGTYLPRITLAELRRSRGELEQTTRLLEECVLEHPQFLGSMLPYATALLEGGSSPDEVIGRIERQLPDPSPAARFMLGTALYEAGATEQAQAQFELVLERQPHSSRARVALGETLLAQRRYSEAAQIAAELGADDPLAAMARRTELFARIAGGQLEDVGDALARAGASGMAPEEIALFQGWSELAGAGTTEISPTSAAVAALAVMLEALLRVQDFEPFEVLLGLLARSPLTARERHHLLGEMYLRRGFLASAAEEWMAVCAQQPETPALLGLARIALLRDMPREARDFVSAVLSSEPENTLALALLTQLEARDGSELPQQPAAV
jgi:tetratricopeptide (TPR) repeat protein